MIITDTKSHLLSLREKLGVRFLIFLITTDSKKLIFVGHGNKHDRDLTQAMK